jgi:CheY-like chemotaxis protein
MAKHRIMIVDDEEGIRETRALLLKGFGYEVSTAVDGLDALLQMRNGPLPDLIVSDLNMPQMSGFEFLSVVRRRFPRVLVIASSGAYGSGDLFPGGIIADGFHSKMALDPGILLKLVADLLDSSAECVLERHTNSAPVWIPRNGHDANGVPFIVVTCTDCLRSFPISVVHENLREVQETECFFCPTILRYVIDFSRQVASPKPGSKAEAARIAPHLDFKQQSA